MAGFTYKSYSFVDKDPIIDEIRTIVQQHGASYKDIHEQSGVAAATLSSWFTGPTKKPQSATINAVLRSMGWKLAPVPISTKAFVEPTAAPPAPPKAAAEPAKRLSTRHVVKMANYKRGRR
jgi:lambda repressor-like predicted transcriptional regulator